MEENQLMVIGAFIGVAIVGYIMFSLLVKILVIFGMAVPDSRKKLGIRATTFGRFMQFLLAIVIVLLLLVISNNSPQ